MHENIMKTSNVFQIHFVWALVSIPYARIRKETGGATTLLIRNLLTCWVTSFLVEAGYNTLKTENIFLFLKLIFLSLNKNVAPLQTWT